MSQKGGPKVPLISPEVLNNLPPIVTTVLIFSLSHRESSQPPKGQIQDFHLEGAQKIMYNRGPVPA